MIPSKILEITPSSITAFVGMGMVFSIQIMFIELANSRYIPKTRSIFLKGSNSMSIRKVESFKINEQYVVVVTTVREGSTIASNPSVFTHLIKINDCDAP